MAGTQTTSGSLGAQFWFVVASCPLVAIDISVIDSLLPDIIKQLGISVADASLVDAITVTVAGALMVPAGKLGDLFGTKRVLLAGIVMAIIGSLLTGLANGFGLLMAGRIAQGAAFAMILTMGLATLNREYPQQTTIRRQAFALYVSVAICSVGIAPALGAVLADYASWRWAFLVVPPAAVVVAIGILRVVPAAPEGTTSQRSFDALGAVLLFVAVGLFLFAIQQGSRYGWWSAAQGISFLGRPWHLAPSPTPMLFAVSALLLGAFLLLERWRAHRQLDVVIDFRLFHIGSYVWGTLAVALSSSASIGALLMVSLYAEYVINAGPLVAGMIAMPLGFAVLVTGPLGERMARFPGRTTGLLGFAVQLVAVIVLVAASTPQSHPVVLAVAMFALGVAWVLSLSSLTSVILAAVPAQLAGGAVGVQTATRYLICGFSMVVMTTLMISVTAFQAQKISIIGLTPSDRITIDAVERLSRPADSRPLADTGGAAQHKEGERFDQELVKMRGDIDKGIRAAGLFTILLLVLSLLLGWRLPRETPAPAHN
jgi:MFS family permease